MGAVISFFTSVGLIALLFGLKHVEFSRGGRFFPSFRARLDELAFGLVVFFIRLLPKLAWRAIRQAVIHAAVHVSSSLLLLVRAVEAKLHGFVRVVRGKRNVRMKEPTSSYFKDVSEHKEQIRKESGLG